MTYTIQLGG